MIRFRKAQKSDAQAIRALVWRVRINPAGLNWQRFLLAVDEQDRIIGCGQIKPHRDGSLEMASIAVQPEWQGQGIGRAIIERLLEEQSGQLYLTCRSSLEPYYQKFGFQTIGFEAMPPSLRRIKRFVDLLQKLLRTREGLLVMALYDQPG